MDVSTSVCDDPKFRRLYREAPELVAPAFAAYMATMAESWKAGHRLTVEHSWPAFLPFDRTVADALIRVGLLDRRGLVSSKAWRSWFDPARKRRDQARERWARYNAKRDADTTPPPRGNDVDTATSVPSVRTVRQSVPSVPSAPSDNASARGDDGLEDPPTKEKMLRQLSERYQDGKLSEVDYERERRRVLAS